MQFTDIFIKRPVLATVISLLILVLGLRSMGLLPIRQYPFTQNAVVTVTTVYTGADPGLIAGFISTPLENSIAQADGIDYLTSSSTQSVSTIQATLRLNYDPNKALTEINTKVNAVINQLPRESQQPVLSVAVGETIDSMYIGFYSKVLPPNKITDYLVRVVQPKLQAVPGVQQAEILGQRLFALRAWLDPAKMAAYNVTSADVSTAMVNNDFISAVGRTDGQMITVNLTASTGLHSVDEFRNLIIKSQNGAIVRLGDVAKVSLGSQNYNTTVSFDGKTAVYIGIKVAPAANLLTVIQDIRKIFPSIQKQLPQGLNGNIVYDASKYVNSSIHEVEWSLLEALFIVTLVIFLFLGSVRSVIIPVVAIPLSLIGTFFIMLLFGYSINLLTLLALVLAIGLVVDDAIIVVENIYRHMENGMPRLQAALQGARELATPIVAISVVLIAVYVPIGFMGGLTGALFTEFAFTLAGAVGISAIIALTLSPMMCAVFLKATQKKNGTKQNGRLMHFIDRQFDRLQEKYQNVLRRSLLYLPVIVVFSIIILVSIYFLYATSESELAPLEDQGIVISMLTAAPNANLGLTQLYSRQVHKIFSGFPETDHIFQLDGINGLNSSIGGLVLKPWEERKRSSHQLQVLVQEEFNKIPGVRIAAFQRPPLPGAGSGLPMQFVITTTESYERLNQVSQELLAKAQESGQFIFLDTDLKLDKLQSTLVLNRDKASQLGLTMRDISNVLSSSLSENYINYFAFSGRSYQVIPQVQRNVRLNPQQLLNYYITTASGASIPLSTIASVKTTVVPESVNHFQQLNSATISGVVMPGITLGKGLETMKKIAQEILPEGYNIDYAGESRQYQQEGSALIITFIFALIIIFLTLAALFESFRDPLIVLISVPMSICGALIFISLGIGGATLNIYTEVGLVTLIGLISKHGILIVQFANDLQKEGKDKFEAIVSAAAIRLRPILMTTAAMVLGVIPLLTATGAGAMSRFNIGLVIASGISIGTLFTLFVVPAMYMLLATKIEARQEDVLS
jgi:multidrug efflux pump